MNRQPSKRSLLHALHLRPKLLEWRKWLHRWSVREQRSASERHRGGSVASTPQPQCLKERLDRIDTGKARLDGTEAMGCLGWRERCSQSVLQPHIVYRRLQLMAVLMLEER